ncbi:MAG: trans-2,3-dihydro-3-hydroxyanthranilate isomerase [Gaiellaceae bacterium]|nr:MAG: trans-2,3-dihydro-3-hydroxyanthranilate isomerase [Gaiellaceae bacterium]
MPDLRFAIVDVFTERPLAGNQLAVFTDARGVDEETMQALASEIGFSETTFVLPPERGGTVRVRIFNPDEEMPFAGHPVLGTAFVLAGPLQRDALVLETGAGPIEVTLERDDSGHPVFGRMRQPVPTVQPVADADPLLAGLGVPRSELPVELYDNGAAHVFVVLSRESDVAALRPAPGLARAGLTGITCVAGSGRRWKARMFWARGEDAATGSAAGPLACHLCRHGLVEWGQEIVISQGAEIGRPSTLYARAEGSAERIEAVWCGGSAVVVARGAFRL